MSEILAAGEPLPGCVFAVSDIMAVGALARLRAAGLDVPGDIALAGFDDIPTLRDVYPPLTTVRLPLKQLGEMRPRGWCSARTRRRGRASSRCPARSCCGTAPSRTRRRPADLDLRSGVLRVPPRIRYFHGKPESACQDDERAGSESTAGSDTYERSGVRSVLGNQGT